jgi:Ca-activated chloride channel family protein
VRRLPLTVGLSLIALFPSVLPAQQPTDDAEQRQAFRAGIDIVSLNVTVTDGSGRYVTGLDEAEFHVFENGIKQDITVFSRRENPIALALLLDSSASMEYKLPTLQTAATEFVRRLKPTDFAQVIDFDGRFVVRQAFTSNHQDLERGIRQMTPGGSTALYNAIYGALAEVKRVKDDSDENPRRRALIVFSDGQDTSSLLSFDELLDEAKRSETAIYTIGLRDERSQQAGFRASEFVLRQLAMDTGGRSFFPSHIGDLAGVYGQIADELANQYSLGYVSSNPRSDGAWRPIVVRLTRPDLAARTKRGYFAPTR